METFGLSIFVHITFIVFWILVFPRLYIDILILRYWDEYKIMTIICIIFTFYPVVALSMIFMGLI